MFSFSYPLVSILLILPLLFRRWLNPQNYLNQSALILPTWVKRQAPETLQISHKNKLSMLFLWLSYCCLILALMQPKWIGEVVRVKDNGRDLLLAIDLSGSMKTKDFVVNGVVSNRFDATKKIVSEFIEKRKGDRIGLILFGDHAYLQSPLSFDLKTVQQLLNEAFLGIAGEKTAIGEAIGLSIKKLSDINNPDKVLILITDGANTSGVDPIEASNYAAKENIVIHTIGVGADEMIVRGFFGRQRINPSKDLDERTLTKIAQNTDGYYFRARDTDELRNIYQKLDELNPVKRDDLKFRPETNLFYIPLMTMLLFALLTALLRKSV